MRAGGKQYRVEPNQTLDVDRIVADVGSTVDLSVLMVGGNGDVSVGTPEVDKAKVVAEVLEHGRDAKVLVFKYKNKTRYRRRHGHRQDYTRLQIKEIVTAAGSFTEAAEKPQAAPKRRRKKEEPVAEPEVVAEETPVAKAEAPEAEATTETAEAKPKRATRARKPKADEGGTDAKPARATRARKPKAEAEEPAGEAEAEEPVAEAQAEEPTAEAAEDATPEEAAEEEK